MLEHDNGTGVPPMSVARQLRNVCPNAADSQHCFHIHMPGFQAGAKLAQFGEACCRCSPVWFRITIPVEAITESLVNMMNEHPIYHFQEVHHSRIQLLRQ